MVNPTQQRRQTGPVQRHPTVQPRSQQERDAMRAMAEANRRAGGGLVPPGNPLFDEMGREFMLDDPLPPLGPVATGGRGPTSQMIPMELPPEALEGNPFLNDRLQHRNRLQQGGAPSLNDPMTARRSAATLPPPPGRPAELAMNLPRSTPQVAGSSLVPMDPAQRVDRMGGHNPYGGTTPRQAAVPGQPGVPTAPSDLAMNVSRGGVQAVIGNDPVTDLRARTAGLLLPPDVRNPYGPGPDAPGAYGRTRTQYTGAMQTEAGRSDMDRLNALRAGRADRYAADASVARVRPPETQVVEAPSAVGRNAAGLPFNQTSGQTAGGFYGSPLMRGVPQLPPPPEQAMRAAGPDRIIGPTSMLPKRRDGEPIPAGAYGDIADYSPEMLDEARSRGRTALNRYFSDNPEADAGISQRAAERRASAGAGSLPQEQRQMLALERAMAKGDARSERLEARRSGTSGDSYEEALERAARGGNVDAGEHLIKIRQFQAEAPLRQAEMDWRNQQGVLAGAQARQADAEAGVLGQANPRHQQFMETYSALQGSGMDPRTAWREAGRINGHTPGQAALPGPPGATAPVAAGPPLTPFDMITDPAQIPAIVKTLGPDADVVAELRQRGATDAQIRQWAMTNMPTQAGNWMSRLGEETMELFGRDPAVTQERRRTSTGAQTRQVAEQFGLPAPPEMPGSTWTGGGSFLDLAPGLNIARRLGNEDWNLTLDQRRQNLQRRLNRGMDVIRGR